MPLRHSSAMYLTRIKGHQYILIPLCLAKGHIALVANHQWPAAAAMPFLISFHSSQLPPQRIGQPDMGFPLIIIGR